jgi:excisionase family DNA binding protein
MSNTELPALGKAAPRALHMREPRHTRSVPTKFFTIAEVADRLAVHPRTICRKIKSGDLVVHRFGGAVRIAEGDLWAFLAAHRGDER